MKSPTFPPFCFRLLLLILLLAPPARAEDPEARLSRAILALMDADQRLSENQRPAALALYEDALTHLKALQENDPDFKPRIVEFRLDYVAEKLAELRPSHSAVTPAPPPRPADEVNYEQLYLETRAQALRDSQRHLEVEKRLMDTQLALRERDQSLAETRNELTETRRRLDTVRTESDQELRETRAELSNMSRFNSLLQERATRVEEENEKLSAALGESRENEARRQIQIRELEATLAGQNQTAEQAATQAADEIQALQNRLLERGQESRQRQERIEELEKEMTHSRERLESLQLLEDTVIELNRRLNARDAAFEELEKKLERIPELEAALSENETAAREAAAALAPSTEALAELTVLHQKLQDEYAAAREDSNSTLLTLRQRQEQELDTLRTEARAAERDLLRKLSEALNESVLHQRQLQQARARIHELENPPGEADTAPESIEEESGETETVDGT